MANYYDTNDNINDSITSFITVTNHLKNGIHKFIDDVKTKYNAYVMTVIEIQALTHLQEISQDWQDIEESLADHIIRLSRQIVLQLQLAPKISYTLHRIENLQSEETYLKKANFLSKSLAVNEYDDNKLAKLNNQIEKAIELHSRQSDTYNNRLENFADLIRNLKQRKFKSLSYKLADLSFDNALKKFRKIVNADVESHRNVGLEYVKAIENWFNNFPNTFSDMKLIKMKKFTDSNDQSLIIELNYRNVSYEPQTSDESVEEISGILDENYEELVSQIDDYRNENDTLKEQNQVLQEKIAELQQTMEDENILREQMAQLITERDNLQIDLVRAQDSNSDYGQSIIILDQLNRSLEATNEKNDEEIQKLREYNSEKTRRINELDQQIRPFEETVDMLNTKIAALEAEITTSNEILNNYKRSENQTKKFLQDSAVLIAAKDAEITQLQRKSFDLNKKNENNLSAIDQLQSNLAEIQAQQLAEMRDRESIEAQFAEFRQSMNKRKEEYENKMRENAMKRQEDEEEYERIIAENASLRDKKILFQQENEKLNEDISKLENSIQLMESKLDDYNNQLELSREIAKDNERNIEICNDDLYRLREENENLRKILKRPHSDDVYGQEDQAVQPKRRLRRKLY